MGERTVPGKKAAMVNQTNGEAQKLLSNMELYGNISIDMKQRTLYLNQNFYHIDLFQVY